MSLEEAHATLGVSPDAPYQDKKQRFRDLAKLYHPDTGGDKEKYTRVRDAWKVIGDASRLASENYDGSGSLDVFAGDDVEVFVKRDEAPPPPPVFPPELKSNRKDFGSVEAGNRIPQQTFIKVVNRNKNKKLKLDLRSNSKLFQVDDESTASDLLFVVSTTVVLRDKSPGEYSHTFLVGWQGYLVDYAEFEISITVIAPPSRDEPKQSTPPSGTSDRVQPSFHPSSGSVPPSLAKFEVPEQFTLPKEAKPTTAEPVEVISKIAPAPQSKSAPSKANLVTPQKSPATQKPKPVEKETESDSSKASTLTTSPSVPRAYLPLPPTRHRRGGWTAGRIAGTVMAVVVVVLVGVLVYVNSGSIGSTATPPLPATASTTFSAKPAFSATKPTVSGSAGDTGDDISLTPTLHGFELNVTVNATFDLSAAGGFDFLDSFKKSCLQVSTPPLTHQTGGGLYEIQPMASSLSMSGNRITGGLTYSAILPGTYGFQTYCNDNKSLMQLGTVTSNNLGESAGTAEDNALVVYSERKASSDLVIEVGAIGGTSDNSITKPTNACVASNGMAAGSVVWRPTASTTEANQTGQGQWYELGTLTYKIKAAQQSGLELYFDCSTQSSSFVWLP